MVEKTCIIEKVELFGQFDQYADVDVFALKLTKRNKIFRIKQANKKWQSNKVTNKTLSDLFDICVGPVVDYRDPHIGTSLKYIVSKQLKDGKKLIK
jgi:hypothetical protein